MKFSFKKGGGDKSAKPARRVSRSGGGGGLASVKAFLVNHLEKILLTVITAMSLMIIYSGFAKERLQSDPQKLEVAIRSAQTQINAPTWPDVRQQRYPEPDTFDQQATADTVAIKDEDFQLPMPFHPILKERQKRRSDPQLIAPVEIEVRAGYGPLAVHPADSAGSRPHCPTSCGQKGIRTTRGPCPKSTASAVAATSPVASLPTESAFFVAITGLVPLKQQAAAYREAFEGAAEFLAERDTPKYLALNVERAEVGADGQPGAWSKLNALQCDASGTCALGASAGGTSALRLRHPATHHAAAPPEVP